MKSVRKLFFVFLLLGTALAYGADRDRMRDLAQKMICMCGGCNSTLGYCPHSVTCPTGVPMKAEIEKMADEGKTDSAILQAMADKYGPTVLAAPTMSGFNLTAWIMPFAALGIGAAVMIYFARRFRAQFARTAPPAPVDTAKYNQRVEEELRKYSPED